MKFSKLLLAGMTLFGILPATADLYSDGTGLTYDLLDDNTATVMEITEGADIIIPSTVTNDGKTYKVTKIGNYVGYYGTAIKSITIGENVTEIADSAFFQASNLRSINLPASLEIISPTAFGWMKELETISVSESSPNFQIVDGGLFSKDGKKILLYPCKTSGSYTVPEGVETIRSFAFFGTNLSSITLPSTLKSIGYASFAQGGFNSILIPASVNSIDESAFILNTGLTDIKVAQGNQSYKMENGFLLSMDNRQLPAVQYPLPAELTIPQGVERIGNYMFYKETALKKVVLPNSCKTIGEKAFCLCSNITDFNFGEGLETIVKLAFQECSSLTSVSLPASMRHIGHQSFNKCSAMTELTLREGLLTIGASAFAFCESLKKVNIPNSVTSINDSDWAWGQTFCDCTSLEEVTFGSGLTEIPRISFNNCTSLKNLVVPGTIKTIGDYSFSVTGIENLTIEEGVEKIGTSAFAFINARSIVVPNSVWSVGQTAFAQCPNLESITFGEDLWEMINFAVFDNPKLTEIILPDGLGVFPSGGYAMCPLVTNLTFPASIHTFGDQALMVMDGLTDITVLSEEPASILGEFFDDTNKYNTVTLHVPANSLEDYREAPVWKKFANIVGDAGSGVEGIYTDASASREIVAIYDMNGTRRDKIVNGINIVVYNDGTRTKVIR